MSPSSDVPEVELSWDVMWCSRHLEPFRAEWPKGAAVAIVKLFQAAIAMPAIADAAGCDTAKLNEALARFAPVCCFVSAEALAEVYREAGVV